MSDHRGRYDANGHAGAADSPPAVSSVSKHNLHEYERESSRSRESERGSSKRRDREREGAMSRKPYHADHREKSERREHDRHYSIDYRHGKDDSERCRHHRYMERSGRTDRVQDSYDGCDYYHNRNYHDSRDLDRNRHHRHRSQSHRSRSRSRSRSKSNRVSGFDMAPSGSSITPAEIGSSATPVANGSSITPLSTGSGQMNGITLASPFVFPNPVQHMTQQATRHARRVYVGGLSPAANEQSIATFFSEVMASIGGKSYTMGDAVINVYINHEKKFAFVEMRTVEEASNAMAVDGINFQGAPVKVRRPSDYNPALAATLGPSEPNPNLNVGAVGLIPGSGSAYGLEGPDRIFVGGLPYYVTEKDIRTLLEEFGPLRGFDLVKDRETGNSRGYAFCVYQDISLTDIACAALDGIKLGEKTLTVRRANQGAAQPGQGQENALMHVRQQVAALQLLGAPTKVVCLTQAVGIDDLKDDGEYDEIMQDMRTECQKFGTLVKVVIPRPGLNEESVPGVGKVFLEYAEIEASSIAKLRLNGRKFLDSIVVASFYPEDRFARGEYDD